MEKHDSGFVEELVAMILDLHIYISIFFIPQIEIYINYVAVRAYDYVSAVVECRGINSIICTLCEG